MRANEEHKARRTGGRKGALLFVQNEIHVFWNGARRRRVKAEEKLTICMNASERLGRKWWDEVQGAVVRIFFFFFARPN